MKTLLGVRGWTGVLVATTVVAAVVPLLNLGLSPTSALHLSDFYVSLLGKILCYAICALAMDLIWGYTGILSLGHGLFFALGGYGMGMYLMRQIGREGQYRSDLPDFMVFLNWKAFPWHWALSDSFVAQMLLDDPGHVSNRAFRTRTVLQRQPSWAIFSHRRSSPCPCGAKPKPSAPITTPLCTMPLAPMVQRSPTVTRAAMRVPAPITASRPM